MEAATNTARQLVTSYQPAEYAGMSSFFGGEAPLSEAIGYIVVLGFGALSLFSPPFWCTCRESFLELMESLLSSSTLLDVLSRLALLHLLLFLSGPGLPPFFSLPTLLGNMEFLGLFGMHLEQPFRFSFLVYSLFL